MDDSLYHVTFAGSLGSIQEHGLQPGGGGKFGGGYAEHSRGKLFLTEGDGVHFWHGRIAATAMPAERADEIAVVLRFEPDDEDVLEDDPLGSRDAMADAFISREPIDPDRLDVWTGSEWEPLEEVDADDFVQAIEDSAERMEEDGEEWVEYDEDLLLPPQQEL